jgi:hypothetical protein
MIRPLCFRAIDPHEIRFRICGIKMGRSRAGCVYCAAGGEEWRRNS